MTVPASKEPKENMRYSNSWPDRAITVKVRVDPVSRAYTIIPTFSDDPLPDVTESEIKNEATTAARKNDVTYSEERDKRSFCLEPMIKNGVVFDARISRVSVDLRRGEGLADGKEVYRDVGSMENSEGIDGSRRRGIFDNFSTNDTSPSLRHCLDPIKSHGVSIKPNESCSDSCSTECLTQRTNRYLPKSLHLSLKSLRKNGGSIDDVTTHGSARLVKSVSNLARLESKLSSRSELNEKRECHVNGIVTDGKSSLKRDITSAADVSDLEKASHFVISTCNIEQREVKPPVIRIIDYDRLSDKLDQNNWQTEHACPKCKSDGFLELQIDPFRSDTNKTSSKSAQKRKNNCVESGTFPDRRFRSRSTTYDFRPDLAKGFGRRTKSFAGNSGPLANPNQSNIRSPPTIDHRKEITLRRHYYPEGGWGYVVVTCSVLVHFLGIGLQLAAPGSWHLSAERKFHHPPLHSAAPRPHQHSRQSGILALPTTRLNNITLSENIEVS